PDFVEAASTLPSDSQERLPPASLRRYDGETTKVSHLHPDNPRLVAHCSQQQCVTPQGPGPSVRLGYGLRWTKNARRRRGGYPPFSRLGGVPKRPGEVTWISKFR